MYLQRTYVHDVETHERKEGNSLPMLPSDWVFLPGTREPAGVKLQLHPSTVIGLFVVGTNPWANHAMLMGHSPGSCRQGSTGGSALCRA